jgi:hypothetical protein
MAYDRADWHHVLREESGAAVDAVRRGDLTGRELLLVHCDETVASRT